MRLFLAINFARDVGDAIADATAPLRDTAPSLRWSTAPRLHLTLKFLDRQPESVVPGLASAIDAVAARHFGFDLRVGGDEHVVGAFPNFRRPRVVWLGVTNDPRLELLHHDVEVACDALGFPIEGRPFRPHITLARIADRVDATILRTLARAAKAIACDVESPVAAVDLMQSVTGKTPVYERLHSSSLRTR